MYTRTPILTSGALNTTAGPVREQGSVHPVTPRQGACTALACIPPEGEPVKLAWERCAHCTVLTGKLSAPLTGAHCERHPVVLLECVLCCRGTGVPVHFGLGLNRFYGCLWADFAVTLRCITRFW